VRGENPQTCPPDPPSAEKEEKAQRKKNSFEFHSKLCDGRSPSGGWGAKWAAETLASSGFRETLFGGNSFFLIYLEEQINPS
jgi:hypothetical protein